jgi:hypothetical protein
MPRTAQKKKLLRQSIAEARKQRQSVSAESAADESAAESDSSDEQPPPLSPQAGAPGAPGATAAAAEARTSASKRKLGCAPGEDEEEERALSEDALTGFRMIDIQLLASAVNSFAACKKCKRVRCLELGEKAKQGLYSCIVVQCKKCGNTTELQTSRRESRRQR